MSWKERFENNFTIFVLGLLVTGFTAGIGAYKLLIEMTGPSGLNWAEKARKEDWVPKKECPAYPVSINITSPGSGSIVEKGSGYNSIREVLVIKASRPIPTSTQVGIIANESGDPNYYVSFPDFTIDQKHMIFRNKFFFTLPFSVTPGTSINLWAIIVDEREKFGEIYSSIEQITTSGTEVTLSPKVSVAVRAPRP